MLWHRLALEMGQPISELKRKMSVNEFASWVAFDRIKPIGGDRVDKLLSEIAVALYAPAGVKTSVDDFAPWIDTRTDEEKRNEQLKKMRASIEMWAKKHNKKIDEQRGQ